jgi:hypothetical protein
MSQKIYLAVLEEIYNNVVPRFQLIQIQSCNHSIIQLHALSLLQKTVHIRDQFFLYMDPLGRTYCATTRFGLESGTESTT